MDNRITLKFTPEEFRDLTMRIELSRTFLPLDPDWDLPESFHNVDSFMYRKIKADNYPETEPVGLRVYHQICRTGMELLPDSGDFDLAAKNDDYVYGTSDSIQNECCDLVDEYDEDRSLDKLPYLFALNDYREKYGCDPVDKEEVDDLLNEFFEMQTKYRKEVDIYGVTHFKFIKESER